MAQGLRGNIPSISSMKCSILCTIKLSVVQSLCLTLGSPMGRSTPGFPVPHYLLEFA